MNINHLKIKLVLFALILAGCNENVQTQSESINHSPEITSTANVTAIEGVEYSYTLTVADIDKDTITISATDYPAWLLFDDTSGELSGTPKVNDIGMHNVTLEASDGIADTSQNFVITVEPSLMEGRPALTGKVLYHNYSGYENWDAELFILDFSDNSVSNISSTWNIDHEMNGVFSPDGSQIIFMGDERGGERNWDIFLWTIGSLEPVNLTAGSSAREEDPKFSPDGSKIVFKGDNDIKVMDLFGNILINVTNSPSIEESMPHFSADGKTIFFASGVGKDSDIYSIKADGSERKSIAEKANFQEYYPVTRDNNSFFFTGWVSEDISYDQVYLQYLDGSAPVLLLFNTSSADYSDASPVGLSYALVSSTKNGGKGGYDNYIVNIHTGVMWSLDEYNSNANSNFEDLGAHYLAPITE
jgi:Tol biopolymer transport system component